MCWVGEVWSLPVASSEGDGVVGVDTTDDERRSRGVVLEPSGCCGSWLDCARCRPQGGTIGGQLFAGDGAILSAVMKLSQAITENWKSTYKKMMAQKCALE